MKRFITELFKSIISVLFVLAMMIAFFVSILTLWVEHPAEQPITYAEHMATIQNGGEADVFLLHR